MDYLNRAYAQLVELYRSMTPASRLTVGLLAAVVLLSAGYLFTHQVSTPSADLMHGVPVAADQLPRMEAAFAKANLKGYDVRGASIRVPSGQEAAYMAALAEAKALPPNFGAALGDAISASNPFEGRQQRETRLKIALQAELSLIIRSMAGIENAYVLYDVDSKVGFNRDKLITATACVKPAGSGQLDEKRVEAIRYLVAGVIAGLKPENVTVSDLNGRTWHGNAASAGSAEENVYISLQRTYEQDLKAKILNALCYIPHVAVETSVELAHQRVTRVKQTKRRAAADQPAAGSPRPRSKENQNSSSGASSQQPNTAAVLRALLGGDDGSEADGAGPTVDEPVEKEGVGLAPSLARASVGVPISYFRDVWQLRNPAEPGKPARTPDQAALDCIRIEESAKIQRYVAQLLPSDASVDKAAELVTVTTFQDIPAQEPPAPGFNAILLDWLRQQWQMLGAIGVALVGLLVLRSLVRRGPRAADGRATVVGPDAPIDGPNVVPPPHARRFHNAGLSPRDELSELVEDDPDTAAHVLRSWIGQVG